jgi:predicted DCC family thiol-disulfide oxidoreductase YuxK
MKNAEDSPVIFFDGECNLCNGFVQFVIKNDPHARFRFASLQSEHAKDIPTLPEMASRVGELSTVVFRHRGIYLAKSTAVLEIAKLMGFPYRFCYVFIVLPKPFRDFVYDWVAANRYRWFGKRDACMLPTPELRSRFL